MSNNHLVWRAVWHRCKHPFDFSRPLIPFLAGVVKGYWARMF